MQSALGTLTFVVLVVTIYWNTLQRVAEVADSGSLSSEVLIIAAIVEWKLVVLSLAPVVFSFVLHKNCCLLLHILSWTLFLLVLS
jgi:hypothetical protein